VPRFEAGAYRFGKSKGENWAAEPGGGGIPGYKPNQSLLRGFGFARGLGLTYSFAVGRFSVGSLADSAFDLALAFPSAFTDSDSS